MSIFIYYLIFHSTNLNLYPVILLNQELILYSMDNISMLFLEMKLIPISISNLHLK